MPWGVRGRRALTVARFVLSFVRAAVARTRTERFARELLIVVDAVAVVAESGLIAA